ncbi:GGDEF domain-containing protein [Fredinandcohnia humi]
MNLTTFKDKYYLQTVNVIPNIVLDHINEMMKYPDLKVYIEDNPRYKDDLTETFRIHCKALFSSEDDYNTFIAESEENGFELGKVFASNSQLNLQHILVITNSTRICSLRHFLKIFYGTELNAITAHLIERVFELSNYRQNSFFRGFVFQQNQQLRNQSITDPLTNVFNRRYFYERVIEEVRRANRIGYPLTLMLIDINNLKQVNDEFGHVEGDKLLKYFAEAVKKIRSNFDSVFRFGGDEFLLLLPNCTEENASEIGKRLNTELLTFNTKASLSFGTVAIPLTDKPEELNLDRYITIADKRMYKSKHIYKNQPEKG